MQIHDFQVKDVTPSTAVSLDLLQSLVDSSELGDAIGLTSFGYRTPFPIKQIQTDESEDAARKYLGTEAFTTVKGECAGSTITKTDPQGNPIYQITIKGHSHSAGVFGPKRGIVCVTLLEHLENSAGPEPNGPIWESTRSAIEVYDWNSGSLRSRIILPGGTFHGILALSSDETALYVGGKFFLRRYDIE